MKNYLFKIFLAVSLASFGYVSDAFAVNAYDLQINQRNSTNSAQTLINVPSVGGNITITDAASFRAVIGAASSSGNVTVAGNGTLTVYGNASLVGNTTLTLNMDNAGTISGPRAIAPPFGPPLEYLALKTDVDSDILANRSTFNDGTNGWIAAVGTYGNMFIADFYMAASGYPEYFTPAQIRNITTKFIAAASDGTVPKPAGGGFVPAGSLPISISPSTAAAVNYYSGLDNVYSHVTGDPIWAIPMLLKQYYDATGDTTGFTSDLAVLKTALLAVPRNGTTHLVSAGTSPSTLWISWGFHDDVQKSGDDLLGSVFYWRAANAMAALYTANGDSANASTFTADAALIAANIDTLWNSGAGMYNAGTVQCAQIDINGSAMAASVGLVSASRIASIASYLDTNSSTLFQSSGYVRQSPTNWSNYWVASPPHYDDYYWSWGNYYVYDTLRRSSPTKAVAQATALANSANNLTEYYNASTAGGAANNLESPMGAFRFINVYASLFPATAAAPTPYLGFSLQGDTTVGGALLLPNAGLVLGENLGGLSDPGAGNALIRGNASVSTAVIAPLVTNAGNITLSATGTTKNVSVTATGNITLNPTGFVSIGTGTPTQLLHVERNIDSNVIIQAVNQNAGTSANARFIVSNGTNTGGLQINGTGQSGPGEVQLYSGGAFDLIAKRNGTERLRMTSNGTTISGLISAGSTPTVLNDSAGKILSAALNTVGVAQGGSGAVTLTGVLIGNGTSAFTGATTSASIASAISDETGSGSLVFATSPTFVTPVLGNATATKVDIGGVSGSQALHVETNTNGNVIAEVYNQNAGASANARFVLSNGTSNGGLQMNGTGAGEPGTLKLYTSGAFDLQFLRAGTERMRIDGSGVTVTGTFTPNQLSGIVGTTTNNSVLAGGVGEFVSSSIASGSAISLTTATAANITSISLTAGDWDVEGNVNFSASTATVTGTSAGISSTSATLPTDGTEAYSGVQVTLLSELDSVTMPRKRISIAGTTTVYLVGKSTFSAGTVTGFGSITARRVR